MATTKNATTRASTRGARTAASAEGQGKNIQHEGAKGNPHEVMMHHEDGRSTEVHKDSVATMAGLGWSTKPKA